MPDSISAPTPRRSQKQASSTDSADPAPVAGEAWSWPRFFRNAAILAAAITLGVWFMADGVWPNVFPKRFGVVEAGELYRSGELTPAATRKVVESHGIRTIIDLGAYSAGSDEATRAQATAEALGVERFRFSLRGDGRGDPNEYVQALRLAMDPANQPVLIHCAAGAQRTSCAIGFYRIIEDDWTIDRVIQDARRYDHDPADNPHVRGMLDRWTPEVERALETGSPIPTPGN